MMYAIGLIILGLWNIGYSIAGGGLDDFGFAPLVFFGVVPVALGAVGVFRKITGRSR